MAFSQNSTEYGTRMTAAGYQAYEVRSIRIVKLSFLIVSSLRAKASTMLHWHFCWTQKSGGVSILQITRHGRPKCGTY
jgi:hypothetical protein